MTSGPRGPYGEPGEDQFRIVVDIVGGVPVLAVHGEVDLAAAPLVRDRLTDAARRQRATMADTAAPTAPLVVLVDLAGVTFIDSTGLSMLVAAHARMDEEHSELRVARVPERVRRVLELTGLSGLLRAYPDVPSALSVSASEATTGEA